MTPIDAHFLDTRTAAERRPWRYARNEPTTRELLADPIAHLLMRADKLSPREVVAVLQRVRATAAEGVVA